MPFNHLVALRDVTGKQSYLREAQQIDQFELPVMTTSVTGCVRDEDAAVISSRENLLGSIYQPDSGFDWDGQSLSLQHGFVRAACRRIVRKTSCSRHFFWTDAPCGARGGIHGFTACRTSKRDRSFLSLA